MALTKDEINAYDDTRLFFVTTSSEDNEEIFETFEDAVEYVQATKFDGKPEIWICIVHNAYKDERDEWMYDDLSDTFEFVFQMEERWPGEFNGVSAMAGDTFEEE